MLIAAVLALIVVGIVFWFILPRIPAGGNIKSVINIVLGLVTVGICLWMINTYIPMAASIKAILNIVVVVATCIGVLQAIGLWSVIVAFWTDLIHGRRLNP